MTHTIPLLIFALVAADARAATHCVKGEIEYFTCRIKDSEKLVSLCGSPFRSEAQSLAGREIDERAWLQYRFGKIGDIELRYPSKTKQPLVKYFGADYFLANDTRLYALSFRSGGFSYSIVSSPDLVGIEVAGRGIKKQLPCAGAPTTTGGSDLNSFYRLAEDLNDLK